MGQQKAKLLSLTLSGTYTVATNYFYSKFYGTLTGNTTLVIPGLDEGKVISFWLKQDGTGSRTLTLPAGPNGTNIVLGPSTAIASAAGKTSKVVIARIGGINHIEIIAQP